MDFKSPLSKSRTSLEVYITIFQRRELVYRHTSASNSIFQRQELVYRHTLTSNSTVGRGSRARLQNREIRDDPHGRGLKTHDTVQLMSVLRRSPRWT